MKYFSARRAVSRPKYRVRLARAGKGNVRHNPGNKTDELFINRPLEYRYRRSIHSRRDSGHKILRRSARYCRATGLNEDTSKQDNGGEVREIRCFGGGKDSRRAGKCLPIRAGMGKVLQDRATVLAEPETIATVCYRLLQAERLPAISRPNPRQRSLPGSSKMRVRCGTSDR